MYAIIDIAGAQFHVAQDDKINAPKLAGEVGSTIELEKVILLSGENGEVKVGKPYVDGAKVQATILGHGQDKKVQIFKKIRREGYTLFKGHRQQHTTLKIEAIIG
ncbi:MAG TPA: 50S ribosomal protein L21 [bacterium]|nr:50S ribosomal protein L21 [bacterium]HQG45674.1 50S ribosomal protein L21 [bacterium]HQI47229.1 50S ribosomal protein L21 [bacterium]HQJ65145.1 50S ribosomal protein L21 [bacterium]